MAQHNEVVCVDIAKDRVDALNSRTSPIIDAELSEYLNEKELNLKASSDLEGSLWADYVVIATLLTMMKMNTYLIRLPFKVL